MLTWSGHIYHKYRLYSSMWYCYSLCTGLKALQMMEQDLNGLASHLSPVSISDVSGPYSSRVDTLNDAITLVNVSAVNIFLCLEGEIWLSHIMWGSWMILATNVSGKVCGAGNDTDKNILFETGPILISI